MFGKYIERINLLECLYVMNEKNYEQDLDQFRNNFINIRNLVKESKEKTEFIAIKDGIFKKFYDINIIDEIKKIARKLNIKINHFIPMIRVGYYYKKQEKDEEKYYIPQTKCKLFGGGIKVD